MLKITNKIDKLNNIIYSYEFENYPIYIKNEYLHQKEFYTKKFNRYFI